MIVRPGGVKTSDQWQTLLQILHPLFSLKMTSQLLPLEYRREIHDLTLLFKLKSGLMNADYTKSFIPASRHTRNSDTNNFDVVATHRQTYFRSSFFPLSVNIWNNLPSALKNCSSLPSLKTALFNLYLSKLPSYQPP